MKHVRPMIQHVHKGVIQNGRLVLDYAEALPHGTRVSVSIDRKSKRGAAGAEPSDYFPRIGKREVKKGIRSLADECDRYAYGSVRKATRQTRYSSGIADSDANCN
jgi:hypothetical protein